MQLLFIHGWSVTNTSTYGELPEVLSAETAKYDLELDVQHIYLGEYISFHDEVMMDDIARAMDRALRDLPGNSDKVINPFSCITHSTGGPVVRFWVNKFYGETGLKDLPLNHLVMLAPANHGSSLAKLGKARLGRIKAWFGGVEPGQRVLDWLSLGSDGQWDMNEKYLSYNYNKTEFYPFVLTGQGIDNKFYDFLNHYLVEKGSDGVVRVAGANMNYTYFSLSQSRDEIIRKRPLTTRLIAGNPKKTPANIPLGVYNEYSHSGKNMGIMLSIKKEDTAAPIVKDILKCFLVTSREDYENRSEELKQLTSDSQIGSDRYCMLVFNIHDDQGIQIGKGDYDLILLGEDYKPNKLPSGFFKDSQMNDDSGRIVYYLDADKMRRIKDGKFGFRVEARPNKGFSYYVKAEFRSEGIPISEIIIPNQTTYVDIQLHRFVDKNVFRFSSVDDKPHKFKRVKPSGDAVGND